MITGAGIAGIVSDCSADVDRTFHSGTLALREKGQATG
jgi:hypothetical protein